LRLRSVNTSSQYQLTRHLSIS